MRRTLTNKLPALNLWNFSLNVQVT